VGFTHEGRKGDAALKALRWDHVKKIAWSPCRRLVSSAWQKAKRGKKIQTPNTTSAALAAFKGEKMNRAGLICKRGKNTTGEEKDRVETEHLERIRREKGAVLIYGFAQEGGKKDAKSCQRAWPWGGAQIKKLKIRKKQGFDRAELGRRKPEIRVQVAAGRGKERSRVNSKTLRPGWRGERE